MKKPTGSPPASLLKLVSPSESNLPTWIRSRAQDEIIEEIARDSANENFEPRFLEIGRLLNVSTPLIGVIPTVSREVLEREQSNEVEHHPSGPGDIAMRGHLKRLVASAILLRSATYVVPGGRLSEENVFIETCAAGAVQSLRSAIRFGPHAMQITSQFLLWAYYKQPYPGFRPFVAFALFVLASIGIMRGPEEEELIRWYSWINQEEAEARSILRDTVRSTRWLFGLNGYETLKKHRQRWINASRELHNAGPANTASVRMALEELQAKLAGTSTHTSVQS